MNTPELTMVECALKLAEEGFHVFPVTPGDKQPPLIMDFPHQASRDPATIIPWWDRWPDANLAISTSRFGENEALLVVDVDNKNGKRGHDSLLRLELGGYEFPTTRTQRTPRSGEHLKYRVPHAVRQGVDIIGSGLDVRSHGGYVMAAPSRTEHGVYSMDDTPIVQAPQWLIDKCGAPRGGESQAGVTLPGINPEAARRRALWYLQHEAPLAIQYVKGDETTFKVAAYVKDCGVVKAECLHLMDEYWNPRCSPPWNLVELNEKILHAYKYGTSPVGAKAAEAIFTVDATALPPGVNGTLHPFEKINTDHAFILQGGTARILWEATDAYGRPRLEHLPISSFHAKFAPQKMQIGRTERQVSQLWIESKKRREYDGLVFMPGQTAPPKFYNLWSRYAYEPAEPGATHYALDAWKEHTFRNICAGHAGHYHWLIGYVAHLIQRPWEKPRIALVLKGAKGVGKNAWVERIAALLGRHALVTADRRYLVGNFNGHLENCLMLVLDEAFWSGDKPAEGVVKNLITGREHLIEHKGTESFTVANLTRVVVLGNEEWLVPASYDERRYAVFEVGEERKQDAQFFRAMQHGMESEGGYAVLLRFLLDVDLDLIDLDHAPLTAGLLIQKTNSHDPLARWWEECLEGGIIIGSGSNEWPTEIPCDLFRSAFRRYVVERHIRARMPADNAIGRRLKLFTPGISQGRGRDTDVGRSRVYRLPSLQESRQGWERLMGQTINWPE